MKEPGTPYRRRLVEPKDFERRGNRRIVVEFDPDTFGQIDGMAKRDDVSFAEKVRQLVEWGLEAA